MLYYCLGLQFELQNGFVSLLFVEDVPIFLLIIIIINLRPIALTFPFTACFINLYYQQFLLCSCSTEVTEDVLRL